DRGRSQGRRPPMADPKEIVEALTAAAGSVPLGTLRQFEIYGAGMLGRKPTQPIAPEDLEQKAREVLPPERYTYVAGGAGAEDTIRANREAFRRWRIVPRFLRNVSRRDPSVEVLGQRFPAPVLLAPIGVQGMLHKDAELAVARAARALRVPL